MKKEEVHWVRLAGLLGKVPPKRVKKRLSLKLGEEQVKLLLKVLQMEFNKTSRVGKC